MAGSTSPPFGAILRQYRLVSGLSQEQLAERAKLSTQAISALERGIRRAPYSATVDLLAQALDLDAEGRTRLHAAVARGRIQAGAPPVQLDQATGNRLTSFIGREQEQTEVLRLLESSRLLTLTGSGGVGKTRLALHTATDIAGRFPDGVRIAELAAVSDPMLLPVVIGVALGVRETPNKPILNTLLEMLREQELLLLLDNCEHLRAGVAACVEPLLRSCPKVRILATSREALGVTGETVWWVPTLPVPQATSDGGPPRHSARSVLRAEAAQLFDSRARAARPTFALTDANAPAVAAICRRLDGLPLAIELAAARATILTPEQIAARLDERFRLLTGGDRTVPRHETLRAALDWSYDLLSVPEQLLLERLAVFAGGCVLEAAEAICVGHGVDPDILFDLLTSLVQKSLVTVEYRGAAARYRMLETVREYARERLEAEGDADRLRRRHVEWALDLAEEVSPLLRGPQQAIGLERLDDEHDNLRAALGRSLEIGDAPVALRLVTALQPLWQVRAHFDEGRSWFARALRSAGAAPPALRALALGKAAGLAYTAGDPDAMGELAQERLAICRALGDRRGMAGALIQIGGAALERHDIDGARTAWLESMTLMRELGDQAGLAATLANLGTLASTAGDHVRAAELHEQALTIGRTFENKQQTAVDLRLLCGSLLELGEYPRAQMYAEEGLAICEELGERWNAAGMLRILGHVAVADGDLMRAADLHERSLAQHREAGNPWSIAEGLYYLARTLLRLDDGSRSEDLLKESLTRGRELRYQGWPSIVLRSLGDAARINGDPERAMAYLSESLDESAPLREPKELVPMLEALAATAAVQQEAERAVLLLGAAAALRETLGVVFRPHSDAPTDDLVRRHRSILGDAGFTTAWEAGAAMRAEEAVAYAVRRAGHALPELGFGRVDV